MMASMNVWARSRTALSMAALLALAACGGGGGSSSSGGTPSTVSVAGVASKGLLAHAKVTAYAIKSDGAADTSKVLGSAITDANGAYQITGLPPSTPVILEVTPLPAEGTRPATTMKDEATGTDVVVAVDSGFSLSAAVVLDGTGTTSAQITPFTDMAAKFAEVQAAGGAPITDAINVANDKIAEVLGVPLNAPPTFDGNGAPTNAAAIKLAAVSALAQQSGCLTSEGTLAKIQCAVDQLRDEVTDTPVAGEPLLSDAFVNNLNTAQENVDVPAGVTEPAPVTNVDTTVAVGGESKTAIQEAKTLIKSVRDTATALSNQDDPTSLARRIKAIEDASYGVAQPLDDGTLSALSAVSDAITEYQNGAESSFALDDDVSYSWPFYGQQVSGCAYFENGAFVTESATRTQYLGCKVAQTAGYDGTEMFVVYHVVSLTDLGGNQFTVQSKLARAPVTYVSTYHYQVGTPVALGSPQTMTVTATESTLLADGLFAPGVELSSSFNSSTESWSDEIVRLGTHQDLDISLSKATVGASTRLSMNGDVRVYDGTAIQSRFSIKPGSFVEGGGDEVVPRAATLILEAQLKTGYKFGGTLTMSDYVQSTARTGPTKGTLLGSFTDMAGAELFNGALALVMPTDDGLNWDATLDGTLVTTGTSTLTVKLTAKQSATVQDDFTVTGRYTQGGNTFFVTVVSSEATLANNQVTFETPSGVGFVLNPKDPAVTSVDVKKGATVLGTYDRASSKLVYADGTYEQF